ncbi:MAG: DUF2911 domain-containing protein [Bacteroidia bacterium]|nr:DUF2911 domain-containing protein [Bacteroidia bacterium]
MKRKTIFTMLFALVGFANVYAQLQLPQPSPKAQVMQTVGLTDITIDYSSPAVKGRTVWGDLVPYDQLWRAGANAATKITFSKDVTIENVAVAKGSYSLFIIPSQSGWTIILNKDASASTDQYKQENDVVRVKTFPSTIPKRERMAFIFSNTTDDQTSIDLEWEMVKVSFVVKAATDKQAEDNIKSATSGTWRIHANAARYFLEKKNLADATKQIDLALSLAPNEWYAIWIKAQIQAELKEYKNAYANAVKAKTEGDKNPQGFFFKTQVEKAIADWKPKADAEPAKKKK